MSTQCATLEMPVIRRANTSPIAEALINNFLIKTVEYFDADCSAFVYAREEEKDVCYMALCGRTRMNAPQKEFLQGLFSLHFTCMFDDETGRRDVAVRDLCMNPDSIAIPHLINSKFDYECLSLYADRGISALAGVGVFARPLSIPESTNQNDHTQFLQSFGLAVLKHL